MENNQMPHQSGAIRKIRKIKRPKMAMNPAMANPEIPTKVGTTNAVNNQTNAVNNQAVVTNTPKVMANKPEIRFNNPEQKQVRNLPQTETFKQDTLYNQNQGVENIRFVSGDAQADAQSNVADLLKNKTVLLLMGLSVVFGLFIGSSSFSGTDASKHGLDWVVANPDVPAGRSRCGLVDQHQGCVLYIMNPEKRNVTGKDFYSVAAKWTKRERYQIETGNMHYGSKQIKPGHIAQINIPPL
jgi:hypothetical protein